MALTTQQPEMHFFNDATMDKLLNPIVGLFYGLIAIAHFIFWMFSEIHYTVNAVPDDAFYYLQIAKNISEGLGSTFDRIHETNGYHPLWQMVLVPIFYLRTTPEVLFRTCMVLQVIISLSTVYILFKYLRDNYHLQVSSVVLVLWYPLVFVRSVNGMETALLILLIIWLISFEQKNKIFFVSDHKSEFIFGLLLGLTVLCRLDMIFLFAIIYAFLVIQFILNSNTRATIFLKALFISFGFSILVMPYFTSNIYWYGNLIPISAHLKSSFPVLYMKLNWELFSFSGFGKANILLVLYAFCFLFYIYFLHDSFKMNRNKTVERNTIFSLFAFFVIIHFFYILLFFRWGVWSWYFVTYGFFFCISMAAPLDEIIQKRGPFKKSKYFIALLILMTFGIWRTYSIMNLRNNRSFGDASYNAAQWAKQNIPPNQIVAFSDCGLFSFFSNQRVINLDGVVNNMEYQNVLKMRQLNQYFLFNKVSFLIQHEPIDYPEIESGLYDSTSVSYISYLFNVKSDPISVFKKNEVYREKRHTTGGHTTAFVIWCLKKE